MSMTPSAWKQFTTAKARYRREINRLIRALPDLQAIQQRLIDNRSPSYPVETPIVYNSALDGITPDSTIRLILVADNPGRREQMSANRRYLTGPSGKIAEKFFHNNPALNTDFRENVIILNKTPIHTPRTVELRELCRLGGPALTAALEQSQRRMARLLLDFHRALAGTSGTTPPVWIIGYSEMKKGGVFEAYTDELTAAYRNDGLRNSVLLYRHFSMNQFTIDLKRQTIPGEDLRQTLSRIGTTYRRRYLW